AVKLPREASHARRCPANRRRIRRPHHRRAAGPGAEGRRGAGPRPCGRRQPVDAAVRDGYYPLLCEPPFTVGWDIAGTAEPPGPGTAGVAVGDRVFGMPNFPKAASAYA